MVMDPSPPRRSNSRTRRSHPTFSDLRLAPLRTADGPAVHLSPVTPKTPTDTSIENLYKAHHSSYLTGRSLPSTPGGILTRSSSRKQLHGGLSRRSSIYDVPLDYAYAAATTGSDKQPLTQKSASEDQLTSSSKEKRQSTLLHGAGKPLHPRSGTQTPIPSSRRNGNRAQPADDWLTHTVSFTSTLVAESKGHSYLHSSSTNLPDLSSLNASSPSSSDDEEAAYRTPREHFSRSYAPTPARSPLLLRDGTTGWGSRFGSRAGSAVPSRRGSAGVLSSAVTPMATIPASKSYFERELRDRGYFDAKPVARARQEGSVRPDFVDEGDVDDYNRGERGGWREDEGEDEEAEGEIARLAATPGYSFGLGSVVDRLVGFGFLDSGDEEFGDGVDEERDLKTREEIRKGRERMLHETMNDRAPYAPDTTIGHDIETEEDQGQMWSDAKWLLEVAGRVLLS